MNNNATSRSIQVAVVAPAMLAWGVERMLHNEQQRFDHVGSAATMEEARRLLEQHQPDVTILDLDGPGSIDAVDDMKRWTASALVALTASGNRELLDQAVVAGVRGIVRTCDPPTALLKAIEKVHDGELWIDRSATSRIFMELVRQHPGRARDSDPERLKIATLTARERQTILAVASDSAAPGKVIARRLCISEHTLRNHLSAIYAKLGLTNRVDLYAFATRHHLDKQQ